MSATEITAVVVQQPQQVNAVVVNAPQQIAAVTLQPAIFPAAGGSGGGSAIAGATISGETACVLLNGLLYPADPTNAAHALCPLVVSTSAGLTGATVNYQTSGDVAGGTFVQGSRYSVGLNGQLTTTARASGAVWFKYVGMGKSTSTITLDIGPSVALA